jgi:hypothetical protein
MAQIEERIVEGTDRLRPSAPAEIGRAGEGHELEPAGPEDVLVEGGRLRLEALALDGEALLRIDRDGPGVHMRREREGHGDDEAPGR